jgi:TRAP-type mannitol/chloroaromatic compound transport system substrate-binding protein
MKRRKFLQTAGLGVAGSALAAPAIAQTGEIHWRLATSWPKSLETVYGGCEYLAKRVHDATAGKFQIRVFAAGEIVPGLQNLDACQAGTVEMAHAASYYFIGKDITFAFDCSVPFGLNSRQQNSWVRFGGGRALLDEFFKDYNVKSFACGNTGTQMGGWFRKEIKTVADFNGLKFRIGGYAGAVLTKLGVIPQQIAGGDIYPALEKGTIDAAEWVGPYDDEKLGFNKVAPYYYYPGWWEGGTQLSAYINLEKWNSLTPDYQAILDASCADAHNWIQGKYDAENGPALKRLIGSGTKLRGFSTEVMAACLKAANEVNEENAAKNPKFKKIYESWRQFRGEQLQWFQVAEGSFDNFMRGHQKDLAGTPAKKG